MKLSAGGYKTMHDETNFKYVAMGSELEAIVDSSMTWSTHCIAAMKNANAILGNY